MRCSLRFVSNLRCRCTRLWRYLLWRLVLIVILVDRIYIEFRLNRSLCCNCNVLGMWNRSVRLTRLGIGCRLFDYYSVHCSNFHCNCMRLTKYRLWYQLLIANLRDKICIRNPLRTSRCCIRNVLGMWNRLEPWTRLDIWYMSFDPR